MKLLKTFKKKSKENNEALNYTFDELNVNDFIAIQEGDVLKLSKNGKLNDRLEDDFYKVMDRYIAEVGDKSRDMQRYERVMCEYAVKLRQVIIERQSNRAELTRLAILKMEKEALEVELFPTDKEKMDWHELVAQVSISVKFRIDTVATKIKEFLKMIKILKRNGNTTDK
jgi:riboflavin synthase alpha subunit